MPLEVSVRNLSADTAVFALSGALTLGTQLKIADTQIQTLIGQGVRKLVLDLSGVPYIDSAGLGALIHSFGLMQSSGGSLRLCGVQERVLSLLQMTHTDKLLPMDADETTSLAAFA